MPRFATLIALLGFIGLIVGVVCGYLFLAGAIAAALGGGVLAWVIAVIGAAILGVFLAELALGAFILCIWILVVIVALIAGSSSR